MSWGKNLWETSQNFMKDAAGKATTGNPMEQATTNYNNWMSQMNNMFSNMNTANTWMNNMQHSGILTIHSHMDAMKSASNDMTAVQPVVQYAEHQLQRVARSSAERHYPRCLPQHA